MTTERIKTLLWWSLYVFAASAGFLLGLNMPAKAMGLSHVVRMNVTMYCLPGHMANGSRVHEGATAVDPRVFPLGTKFYIPILRKWVRGEDTGSAVRGYHLDVWHRSCYEAIQWGSRTIKVIVHGR